MADDNQPERPINIQGTVNTSNQASGSEAVGVKVNVERGNVHVHGNTALPASFGGVALVGVLAFLGAVLVNIATSQLPPGLQPYLWLSWPLALLVTGVSIWVAYRQSRSGSRPVAFGSSLEQRNRRAMLQKVKTIWIEGLLEQSLAKELRIELNLTTQPDAVELPLNALVQELNRPPRPLPAGTPIIKVFDQMGGALLILGAPGAGKTTLLLELARDLIERAEQDEIHPIPIVFNLSTWTASRRPLDKWLVEELSVRYRVPPKPAEEWIKADTILPLLDGLDEVAAQHRDDCVEAINRYRNERGLVSVVVCSRITDYEALSTKLRLQGAISIQPLTRHQVEVYLKQVCDPLAAVCATLGDESELWEVLTTPLVLSIVVLAYKDKYPTNLGVADTLDKRGWPLFDDYIEAMFRRRRKETRYKWSQVVQHLSWLASQMLARNQTIFYIDWMQPDLLPSQKRWPLTVGVSVVIGLLGGLLGYMVFAMLGEFISGPVAGVVFGLFGGLPCILLVLAGYNTEIENTGKLQWGWPGETNALGCGAIVGLTSCGTFNLISFWVFGEVNGVIFAVIYGFGLGLSATIITFLFEGLDGRKIEVRITPNQEIRRSARNAVVWGSIGGVVGGLGFVIGIELGVLLARVLPSMPSVSYDRLLDWTVASSLLVGFITAIRAGGRAVLQHYSLRWLLYRNGILPLRLVPFLDYCTERIFLRKVGGGYIFVHRLLMEHFASLYTESNQPAAPPSDRTADC